MDEAGMTVGEAGRKGGRKTFERHGHDFYEGIGHKGGTANAATHDHAYFVAIGHKGSERQREMVAKAKALEATERGEQG
ncbi:MAG: hypothetical protein ACYC4L_17945 [Chloroflexota bacterium]